MHPFPHLLLLSLAARPESLHPPADVPDPSVPPFILVGHAAGVHHEQEADVVHVRLGQVAPAESLNSRNLSFKKNV